MQLMRQIMTTDQVNLQMFNSRCYRMDDEPSEQPNSGSPFSLMAPREKVRTFPTTAGVYLMKDTQGRVIYVGKAVNLRSRAGSYFTKAAEVDRRTADLIPEIADIDFIEAESEVDALLMEARLIKDIQPRFNIDLKDKKFREAMLLADQQARELRRG